MNIDNPITAQAVEQLEEAFALLAAHRARAEGLAPGDVILWPTFADITPETELRYDRRPMLVTDVVALGAPVRWIALTITERRDNLAPEVVHVSPEHVVYLAGPRNPLPAEVTS